MLLCGCSKVSDVYTPRNYSCLFSDGAVEGSLTLKDGTVTFTDFSVDGETTDITVTVTDQQYTVTVGGISVDYSFDPDKDITPIAQLGKTLLELNENGNITDIFISVNNSGFIEELTSADGRSYTFSDHK